MEQDSIEYVKNLQSPSQNFLCKLKANKYSLQFLQLIIKNPETNKVFFSQNMDKHENSDLIINDEDYPTEILKAFDEMRMRNYTFSKEFFECELMSVTLQFKVGEQEVKNMSLVENHYFKKKRIAQYNFDFPFCAPNSINTWEYIYNMPKMNKEDIKEIVEFGEKTSSDTFFFVGDKMILHNKSEYLFIK